MEQELLYYKINICFGKFQVQYYKKERGYHYAQNER